MQHVSAFDPIVATAAQKLGFASIATIEPVVQTGVGVFNACGIACVLMLLQEVGIAQDETVAHWSRTIDGAQDGTTPANLAGMIAQLGATPATGSKATFPYIELIRYNDLDHDLQWSVYRGHKFNHWIVRVSDIVYFDPLFPSGQGGPITTVSRILDGAEISASSRVAITEKFTSMANVTATVNTEVRVRIEPRIADDTWTPLALKEGKTITGEVVGDWLKYTNADFVVYNKAGARIDALWSILRQGGTEFISVPTEPPRPVATNFKLGVSVLIAHHLLQPAYDAGCRAFLVMEGLLAALQFKQGHPDAVVMYRKYIKTSGIPPAELFFGECHVGNGVVFVTPLNECDSACYGSPGEIEQRAKFDVRLGQECKAHGTIFAAGGFSVGTPDFTRPDICDAMRRHYAPAYNAGLLAMNMHLYSPTMDHIYKPNETRWYERRWEFLFTKCGFNPDPNLLGIYCDETGVDEGGRGGFAAHGASADDVAKWSAEFAKVSKAPLMVGGAAHASPMRGAAVFQAGDTQNWAGYNIAALMAEIGRANV